VTPVTVKSRSVDLMGALTAGTRVRAVNQCPPVVGCEGEVIEWRGVAFHVKLDDLGTQFFEPEVFERVRD
jgi:hypothetical protein